MIHQSSLEEEYFNNIKNGLKIYEIRIYDKKRKSMKISDKWSFTYENNKILVNIDEINIFKSFREALSDIKIESVLCNIHTIDNAIKTYESFPNYKENAEIYGVVRFKISMIS